MQLKLLSQVSDKVKNKYVKSTIKKTPDKVNKRAGC